ncbi:hypothetical protein A2715_04400 [Candidatus Woesebacteria bacterium RIFCSPHIGHO2_01_FULL_39_32]|uniref:Uncharacterized protein n=2 Tax=Candidatus Woeseibacteriota TaxID=1752722 RepID=A0A0G0PZF7_9BACT|nr:MAG: hypothetical protein UT61_C0006G0032 [Candidatus Woesebacteria bacterium GW2011_GWA1_39_8]OGM25259.1 MAG: hypothetical protein A2715_04400 [Candidatus Woesebacteria bacterium RIFCSPHIGHO2_01_FULL_39_32]OGM37759.1 MAG: hypothetical protein A3F01_01610 [Candidatus Woesebacteria bacterium RIFCSPHIGHO2_12_FULL_38_11]OGM64790.1 MAG: hypothetical protein A2893_04010 [Candidatus Woesebacteria bacterium RIFCSPLOWO2_01_FULL_39_25]
MHLIITAAAISILAIGIFFSQRDEPTEVVPSTDGEKVLSEDSELSETSTPYPTKTSDQVSNLFIEDYTYPGATITSTSANTLTLESQGNVDAITDWYKDKIQSTGMNVKTFVVTKANDNVLNKLGGSNSDQEVNVEIEKKFGESKVLIRVTTGL